MLRYDEVNILMIKNLTFIYQQQRTTETSNLVSAEKNEKTFPDKIPEPGYKMEIDWYYTPLIIVFHIMLVTCFTIPEKPLYTFVYGKKKFNQP